MRTSIALLSTSLSFLLFACGGATPASTTPATAAVCAVPVATLPPGLVKTDHPAPIWTKHEAGKGNLSEATVYVVQAPVTVYRVFSAASTNPELKLAGPDGAFWTLERPTGTADCYRANFEICEEWNTLDMVNECQIEIGTEVTLGPGQSTTCNKGNPFYPGSAMTQVALTRKKNNSMPVINCKESAQKWAP